MRSQQRAGPAFNLAVAPGAAKGSLRSIFNSRESVEAVLRCGEDARKSFLNGAETDWLRQILGSVFDQRDLVWLGGTRGVVEITSNTVGGSVKFFRPKIPIPIFLGRPLVGEKPLSTDATLEVFYSPDDRCVSIVVSAGSCPRSITVPSGIGNELTERIGSAVADRQKCMDAIQRIDGISASFLRDQPQYELFTLGEALSKNLADK